MYNTERFYRSVLYFTSQIVPSGVEVIDGQAYGIRLDDPSGQAPNIAVTVGDITNAELELGSFSTQYPVYFYINALSRMQRDALKDIVRSGIYNNLIPIYADFDQLTPSGAVQQYAELGDYFQARDIPNFSSDKEKYFWGAVVTVALDLFGL